MGVILEELDCREFADRLRAVAPDPPSSACVEALFAHYLELRRWAPKVSLLGPAARGEIFQRHYGESLAALPLVPGPPRGHSAGIAGAAAAGSPVQSRLRLVDLGSGAGFPGLVLAAARPDLEVTLVEAREKKWSFLAAASRRAALPCHCLNARVGATLPAGFPEEFDLLTIRALRLPPRPLAAVLERLSAAGSLLLWLGARGPELPAGWAVDREIALPGSRQRRIVRCVRGAATGAPLRP